MTEIKPSPSWPTLEADHPLTQFIAELPSIIDTAQYSEVYGITLDPSGSFTTKLILQKFLRANANDLPKAKEQLLETLKWRKDFQPLNAMEEVHEEKRFGGLGYVTLLGPVPGSIRPEGKEVVTFNIYGAVENNETTFGDIQGFLRWRVGLMELSLSELSLSTATTPIPDYGTGPDPYQCIQVHDYLSVSFLRMDPHAKAASSQTIALFQKHYPETLSRKFFVNVPLVMGWMFSMAKLMLSKETIRKFTVLSYGKDLEKELGEGVPEVYGGKGKSLSESSQTLKLA